MHPSITSPHNLREHHNEDGTFNQLVHNASWKPELHTTSRGDYQRWYATAERKLEERLEQASDDPHSRTTPLLVEPSTPTLGTLPASPPALLASSLSRVFSNTSEIDNEPTDGTTPAPTPAPLKALGSEVCFGTLRTDSMHFPGAGGGGGGDVEVTIHESEFEDLSARLATRCPDGIRSVLKTLRTRLGDTMVHHDEAKRKHIPRLPRAISTLWVGLKLCWAGEEHEDTAPPVRDTSLLAMMCRLRIYMADVAIGMLLQVRERVVATAIFWKWVELSPRTHAYPLSSKIVHAFAKIESALDSVIGIVHKSASEIARFLNDTERPDFNSRLRTLLLQVTQLNIDLLTNFLAQSSTLLATLDPTIKRADLIPRSCLHQISSIAQKIQTYFDTPAYCDGQTVAGTPLTHARTSHTVFLFSAEFELLESFPTKLKQHMDTLHREYHRHQLKRVGCVVLGASLLFTYFTHTGHVGQLAGWWARTKPVFIDFFIQHVVEPVKAIYEELFTPVRQLVQLENAVQSVEYGNRSLRAMLVDFIKTVRPECTEAIAEAEHGDIDSIVAWEPVMHLLEEQIKSPLFNVARGEIGRALLLQAIKTRVQIDQQMVEVEGLLRANRMNLNAFATVPACGLMYAIFQAVWWVSGVFRNSLRVRDPLISCMFSLREIHRLFSRLQARDGVVSFANDAEAGAYMNWLAEHGRVLAVLSSLEEGASELRLAWEIKSALADDIEELKTMYAMNSIDLTQLERIWSTYPWIMTSAYMGDVR